MKQFAFITSLLCYSVFSFGQVVNDDLSFFNYSYDKDIIKSNKVETVTIEMMLPGGKKSNKAIYHFDNEGLLDKQSTQDEKGNVLREFYFSHNSNNDLILRIGKDYENKRTDTVRYFKYYENNKLIRDSSSEMPVSYTYVYNVNGKLFRAVTRSNFGPGSNTKRVMVNKFDDSGRIVNIVETVFQNENDLTGTIFSDRDISYNNKGKIEKEAEKLNGKYSWMANKGTINYVYDSNGYLTQVLRTNAASYTYTYNSSGLIVTKKMNLKIAPDGIDDKGMDVDTFDKYIYTFRK
ncbi:MAG: hypothetical protein QM726_12805 [Chitinophagaceae bacterium]